MGHLEFTVMELLWAQGEASVHDVMGRLDRRLAYNTVMTTLDRLYKKGLLSRTRLDRAYFYTPRLTRQEWEQKQAGDLVSGFLARGAGAGGLLVSCLLDAVAQRDSCLLDDLEERIRLKRREIEEGRRK